MATTGLRRIPEELRLCDAEGDAIMSAVSDSPSAAGPGPAAALSAQPGPQLQPDVVPVAVTLGSAPVNEYVSNHTLLGGAFPCLFPLGLTTDMLGGGSTAT